MSVIVFQLPFVIANPMTILYFNGGIKGYWLAIIAVCMYLYVTKKTNGLGNRIPSVIIDDDHI
ncbi:hypothetical protein ACI2OX_05345 [Bacillus sp. N9]